jgi:hypothetical protein
VVALSKMKKEDANYLEQMAQAASKMTDVVMDAVEDVGEEVRRGRVKGFLFYFLF